MFKNFLKIFTFLILFFSTINAYEIRVYQESDYPYLESMMADNPDVLLPGENLDERVKKSACYIKSPDLIALVCTYNNEPIGFILYSKKVPSKYYLLNWFLNFIYSYGGSIQALVVKESHRGHGIGKALLLAALKDLKAQGFKRVILQTKIKNKVARSLYEKYGFRVYDCAIPFMPEDCMYRCELAKFNF